MTIHIQEIRKVIRSLSIPHDIPLLSHLVMSHHDFLRLGCPYAVQMGEKPEEGVLKVVTDPSLEVGHARVEYREPTLS
jgi:hypothetical protein